MVIEYLAYQLIDGYKSGDGNVTTFLDYYDFYLVPFHNPDGKFCSIHERHRPQLAIRIATQKLALSSKIHLDTDMSQDFYTLRRTIVSGEKIGNPDLPPILLV